MGCLSGYLAVRLAEVRSNLVMGSPWSRLEVAYIVEASLGLGCIQVEVKRMDPSGSPDPLVGKRRNCSGAPLGAVDGKGARTSQVSFIQQHHIGVRTR